MPTSMASWRALVLSLALAIAVCPGKTLAQESPGGPSAKPQVAFTVLIGRWVRKEGGYVISVKAIDTNGRLDASYANPYVWPFHAAEVTRDGENLKLFFELRAGGYNGSTYTLSYDAASDQLTGVFYQAVAKQKFDVTFLRAR